MRRIIAVVIVIVLASPMAHGGFSFFGNDASKGSSTSWTWSWSTIKEKVKEKWNQFVSSFQQPSSTVASTEPGQSGQRQPAAVSAPLPAEAKLTPETKQKIQKSVQEVKNIQIKRVVSPGIPFQDKNLVVGRNDIPVFEFKKFRAKLATMKVKKVPLLNVGEEPTLDDKVFSVPPMEPFPLVKLDAEKQLPEPKLLSASEFKTYLGEPVVPALVAEKIQIPILEPEKKVTAEKIARLVYKIEPDFQVTLLPVTVIAEEDLKMLRGLILFEKKDQCHIAAGIFSDLIDSKNPEINNSSRFHLGVCLHEMNLPTESLVHLTRVIRNHDAKFTATSIKTVLQEIQGQHEDQVVEALLTVHDDTLIPQETLPDINYYKAKYFVRKGQYAKAMEHAEKVPKSSDKYFKAQYIASVAEYVDGKLDASIARSRQIADVLSKKGTDKDVLALVEVNLGRVAFQRARFKEALEAFQKVPKDSALWMSSLTEQAWVQLQSKDAAGAIGNMHSIQSPYFDGVFKPESYVVRSIGYLNICQYADAHKSLAILEHKYIPWLEKMEGYSKNHSYSQTYATVIRYLQGKANMDADGLPFQVIREAARQRDFLNYQEGINQLIDENSGYAFIRGLIEKDKRALTARRNATVTKIVQLQAKIKKARVTPGAMKDFNAWRFELSNYEDFLSIYDFKMATMKEGEEGLKALAPKAQNRIAQAKNILKEMAGKALKSHLSKMAKNLKQNLENNELLKYEIYAGSGENLRYQVAGGRVGAPSKNAVDRKPAGVNWDFQGEFWEDEIGHYRSSLKNNCQIQAQAKKELGQ